MDEFLDTLWFTILAGINTVVDLVNWILAPLNFMGPAVIIFLIVLVLVAFTKTLARTYTTKRYRKLKGNYDHWFDLRREAMASEDREKGKALAKNIDQAELNKAYYDYFFEGFLKNMLTTILPLLLMAAYVAKAYNPENLMKTFGQPHIFRFADTAGKPVVVSAFFWFVISLLIVHILWFIGARVYKKNFKPDSPKDL
ncbi:MAG: hypothetical protein GY697_20080 [Desulfobacterales bacterium]|nr:hypothetical protein [Desulfobacterales bacterium]